MSKKEFYTNLIFSASLVLIVTLILYMIFKPVFTLIDDSTIQEILSGSYTGKPDGHVVYIKYALSFFISRLYMLTSSISWYGLLLTGLGTLCLFIVVSRIQNFLLSLGFLALFLGCVLKGFIYFTYTSVAGLLGATAIFFFLTIRDDTSKKHTILSYVLCIALFLLGFMIRQNAVIMLLPALFLAVIYKYKKSLIKTWMLTAIGAFVCLGAILIVEFFAYNTLEWKYYQDYNTSRTKVYETRGALSYEKNQEAFLSVGINEELHALYREYYFNFGPEVEPNALMELSEISKPLASQTMIQRTFTYLSGPDYKTGFILFSCFYLLSLVVFLLKKKWKEALYMGLLIFALLIPWIYMLLVKKVVYRVGVTLFYTGIFFVVALLINNRELLTLPKKKITPYLVILSVLILLSGLWVQTSQTLDFYEKGKYQLSSEDRLALEGWCNQYPENIYFLTNNAYVDLGTKINTPNTGIKNLLPLGQGWLAKAPVVQEKLRAFGIHNIEKDLLNNENAFILTYFNYDMNPILNYYEKYYDGFSIELAHSFTTPAGGKYAVYRFFTGDAE